MVALPALSVQLYSVRNQLADDLPGTLARLAEIGLSNVEPFDLLGDPDALRAAVDANGLSAPSAHARVAEPGVDLGPIFRAAQTVGVRTVIAPMTDPSRWASREGVQTVADDLNRAAELADGYGLRVGYHNHAFELENTVDGRPALELLGGCSRDRGSRGRHLLGCGRRSAGTRAARPAR